MKIALIGATGKIGSAAAHVLAHHDIVPASRASGVDLTRPDQVRAFLEASGPFDAIVAAAGRAVWKPLAELSDADFTLSIASKLMAQVNLVRLALPHIRDNGSITLTSGIYAREPEAGASAIALANSGVEGFAIGASRELPRGIRINVVSPPTVGDRRMAGSRIEAMPADEVALAYLAAVEGHGTGQIIDTRLFARR